MTIHLNSTSCCMQALAKLLLDLLRLGVECNQIQDIDVGLDEDRVALHKWIRLVAERLNVPVKPYIIADDRRASKRQRGTVEQLLVVPDSLESPYLHNSLLDIEELMK